MPRGTPTYTKKLLMIVAIFFLDSAFLLDKQANKQTKFKVTIGSGTPFCR